MAAMENGRTVGAAYVDGEHDGNGYRAVQPDLRVKKMIHLDRAISKSMLSLSFELSCTSSLIFHSTSYRPVYP